MSNAYTEEIYRCGECGSYFKTRDSAEKCCSPRYCTECGIELPKKYNYTQCPKCHDAYLELVTKKKFDNATKVKMSEADPEKVRMMYSETYGYNDGYFSEIEELEDFCEEHGKEMPQFVYGTNNRMISMDATDIVENACDDLYPDVLDYISDDDIKELQDFLDKWCEKRTETTTFTIDENYIIYIGE